MRTAFVRDDLLRAPEPASDDRHTTSAAARVFPSGDAAYVDRSQRCIERIEQFVDRGLATTESQLARPGTSY